VATYLKRASKTPETESAHAREVVSTMLAEIDRNGEAAVRAYARDLDGWSGDIVVPAAEIERRTRDIPAGVRHSQTDWPAKRAWSHDGSA
jgi:sulfopropanediol 3-dehydrogenase